MTLNTLALAARPDSRAPNLLVMLAGAYDKPADFIAAGFDVALRSSHHALDLLLVESDLAAVCDGSLADAVEQQIVAPAREQEYARVLTGGISIGGLTALMHADRYPDSSDGLVLIAPYPGNRSITREIAAGGGLATWPAAADYPTNDERLGWRALQRLGRTGRPPVWLGYGREDRFAGGHALMAAVLEDTQVASLPGGHDWPTWLQLWHRYLDAHC